MNPFLSKTILWFSVFMSLFYIGLGIFMIVGDAKELLPPPYHFIMGGFLIIYGGYRMLRFRKNTEK